MPLLYVFTGAELAMALRSNGDDRAAQAVSAMSTRVAETAGFDDLARTLTQPLGNRPAGMDSAAVALQLNPAVAPRVEATQPARLRRIP